VGYSPHLFEFVGAHPQTPLPGGCAPLDPPLPTPRWLRVRQGFWVSLVVGLLMWRFVPPSFEFVGGTPHTPRHGGFAPLDPPFAHPRWLRVCQRFWVPLVAGLLMLATRPFFWYCGGHVPHTPCQGGFAPLDPPFAHPRWLRVCRRFVPSEAKRGEPRQIFPLPSQGRGSGG